MSKLVAVSEACPSISIVVRSFNEERFIRRLFVGLRLQTRQDVEVILVDSGSTDATVEIAESFGARIIGIPKAEFSFGRSLNIGCAAARGEILVFASAHVYPARVDWLERLVDPFSDERVALVYGKQRGNEITKFSERQIFVKWFPDASVSNQTSYFCNNANCAVRRCLWQELRYDETLTGLEDIAWAREMQRRGAQLAYASDAEIIHVHDEAWDRVRNRYRREAMALRAIEPTLRFFLRDFIRLTAANIISDLREARRQDALRRELAGIVLFRFNQFWGTYLGHLFHTSVTAEIKDRFYFPPDNAALPAYGSDDGASFLPVASAQPGVHIDYDRAEARSA